jgi:oligopeptide transport system substrate-binding protein
MWKQTLGIDTTLANQEWQTFLDARKEGNFDLARAGWCADYNEASSFLDIMTSNSEANDSKYLSAEFDALMEESRTAEEPAAGLPAGRSPDGAGRADPAHLLLHLERYDRLLGKGLPVQNAQETWYAKDLYRVAEQ